VVCISELGLCIVYQSMFSFVFQVCEVGGLAIYAQEDLAKFGKRSEPWK